MIKIFIRGEDPSMYGIHSFEKKVFHTEDFLLLEISKETFDIISNYRKLGLGLLILGTFRGKTLLIDSNAICTEQ